MSLPTDRFCTNSEEVAAKVMDGEAVMINLSDGSYYSMDGVGGTLWELLAAGLTVETVVTALATHYNAPVATVQSDVERVVEDLIREKLVLLSTTTDATPPTIATNGAPYVTPQLVIYRDMQDLLALDPPMPGMDNLPYSKTAR